jgi:hypothetical protein
MNWRIFSIGFTFVLTLTTSPLLLANGEETGIAHRVAALEQQMATLMAELESVSPVADLTGKTYCVYGQGSWLSAEDGVSAEILSVALGAKLEFTSPSELIVTGIYDIYSTIHLPAMTMIPQDDGTDTGVGTYTVVGNRVTVMHSNEGESDSLDFLMTPDGQVLVFIDFGLENDGTVQTWNVGTLVGVQATSCDL